MNGRANDRQVGGEHYRAPIQHWDFVAQALDSSYFEGQITKYVSRWRKKNGAQDLEKALHYLQKLRELFKDGEVIPMNDVMEADPIAYQFADSIGAEARERGVFTTLSSWRDDDDLRLVQANIESLLATAIREATEKSETPR